MLYGGHRYRDVLGRLQCRPSAMMAEALLAPLIYWYSDRCKMHIQSIPKGSYMDD